MSSGYEAFYPTAPNAERRDTLQGINQESWELYRNQTAELFPRVQAKTFADDYFLGQGIDERSFLDARQQRPGMSLVVMVPEGRTLGGFATWEAVLTPSPCPGVHQTEWVQPLSYGVSVGFWPYDEAGTNVFEIPRASPSVPLVQSSIWHAEINGTTSGAYRRYVSPAGQNPTWLDRTDGGVNGRDTAVVWPHGGMQVWKPISGPYRRIEFYMWRTTFNGLSSAFGGCAAAPPQYIRNLTIGVVVL